MIPADTLLEKSRRGAKNLIATEEETNTRSPENHRKRSLKDPQLAPIQCHVDDRGFLYQILGTYDDIFPHIARAYVVGNFARGTIRGFHMHKKETKAYFVASGTAKFVVVGGDKKTQTFVLNSRNPSVLVVPPNNNHGWISLEDATMLVAMSDKTLKESVEDDYRSDPLILGEEIWKVTPR